MSKDGKQLGTSKTTIVTAGDREGARLQAQHIGLLRRHQPGKVLPGAPRREAVHVPRDELPVPRRLEVGRGGAPDEGDPQQRDPAWTRPGPICDPPKIRNPLLLGRLWEAEK